MSVYFLKPLWNINRRLIFSLQLLILGISLIIVSSGLANRAAAATSGPITISTGGVYSGNWLGSTTGAVITIATSAPVTIQNSSIENTANGDLIDANYPGAQLTVRNTSFKGPVGGTAKAIFGYGFKSVDVENCTILRTWGIRLDNIQSGGSIVVTKNKASNIQGSATDASHFFQAADNVNSSTIEVSWNEIIGQFQQTYVADVINIFDSGFAKIHDNYVQGAYPQTLGGGFSGSGIMLDTGAHDNQVYNNQVVDTVNTGIGIAGGYNNQVHDNRMVFDGRDDAGDLFAAANIGLYVWNYENESDWANNDAWNNVIGWIKADGTVNNAWLPDCSGTCANTGLPGPITHATEQAEYQNWLNKLASNNIQIGTTAGSTLAGDLNGDNHIDAADLTILLSNWQTSNATADINADGTVNVYDLSILLSHYGS